MPPARASVTGVAAERFGGQVLDTMAIENFISVPHTEGPKLVSGLEQHVKDYDVDVMNLQKAARLIPAQRGRRPQSRSCWRTARPCAPRP
jgi:alkyl hydroperoxide reductase subunit AhpF